MTECGTDSALQGGHEMKDLNKGNLVGSVNRRKLMKVVATGAFASAFLPSVVRAGPITAKKVIRIGHVIPLTGPLAAFGEAFPYVMKHVQEILKGGLKINGETYAVEILSRDSQSNAIRAGEVATDLILRDKVDLLLAECTPDCVNPVSDQAEINGVPCITTNCPWQPYVFGRKGDPKVGFEWTYHFFWGLEDATAGYVGLWKSIETNKKVGALFPNDVDANAWADPAQPGALPLTCKRNGFELLSGGSLVPGSQDYSAQIAMFQKEKVDIVTGVLAPPDFGIFWQQASQQNFRPKIVTIAKALLFPSVINSIGASADGLSTEIWWSPSHPYKSSLTGQSSADLCQAYTAETGQPWTQPMGFGHALFEVAIDVLKRTKDVENPGSILKAIKATNYSSIVGQIKWDNSELKNISKTAVVAGQWTKTDKGFDLVVCDNSNAPEIPVVRKLRPLS
jgi:branched-chain amino acid transport system substrate-binding protein